MTTSEREISTNLLTKGYDYNYGIQGTKYDYLSIIMLMILRRREVREKDEKCGDYRRRQKHLLEQGPKGITDRVVA